MFISEIEMVMQLVSFLFLSTYFFSETQWQLPSPTERSLQGCRQGYPLLPRSQTTCLKKNCKKKVCCSKRSFFYSTRVTFEKHSFLKMSLLQLFSKEMAAVAGKTLLRKEKIWLCWCSKGRHATRACPEDHQGPWRHDQQKVSPWQEGVPWVMLN